MSEEHRPPGHHPGYTVEERRRIEQQLAHYALLEENTHDGFIATDELYVVRAWNKGAEQLYGWTAEEVLGRSVMEVARADLSDEQLAEARRQLDETDRWRAEVVAYRKDGTPVWVELTNVAVRGEGGQVSGYLGIHRDVTERKQAEEQLAYHAYLLDNIHDAVTATDERYIITVWNRGAEQMFGWTADEALGRRVYELIPTDYSDEQLAEALRELSETGRRRSEGIRYRKDGTPVYADVLTIALRGERGEFTGYLGIHRDITERKQAEEALRESSREIENMLESITDAFYALDREWRFTYINERALHLLREVQGEGLTREDLLRKSAWELYPEAVGSMIYQKYHEAMREQKTVDFEAQSPVSGRWVEVHAYPSEEGLAVYWQDITERKRAEQVIERRTHQQAVVAELGVTALAGDDLDSLMDEVVACVTRTLGVEYAKVVELLPGGEEVLVRAGVGWEEGLVGSVTALVPQTAHTLRSNEPVIVENLSTEERFEPAPRLVEHGVVSCITVVIPGRDRPFGSLGAHSRSRRTFSGDDANFLQAVANVLATAIEREGAEDRVEEGREAERSRMARDLHDEALQDLTDALAQTQQIQRISEDPQQTLRLARLLETLDRIGPQLRGAIYDLRLEGEQTKLFPELLESLVGLHRGMAPESDIALEVHDGVLSGPLGERGRPLLRIVGEALTNVRRHSGASHVRVGVGITEEKLWAEVQDDGRGFDVAQQEEDSEQALSATGGMGIRGMRERARALGGDLEIESDPETGTKVRFKIALEEGPEDLEEEVHVLLVDDHATVRDALASAFEEEEEFEVVGQAGSLEEARGMLGEIDVAVVDLGLPDGYGGDLIRDLREANPRAQALVLSASLEQEEIAQAVEAGAAGVLHKTAHLEEVVGAVKLLRAGETLMPLQEVVELLRFASSRREQEHEAQRVVESLSPREREVLQALAEGLGSEEIAQKLHISLRTERNHMANILSKLEVHSQLQALVFALRHGVVEIP